MARVAVLLQGALEGVDGINLDGGKGSVAVDVESVYFYFYCAQAQLTMKGDAQVFANGAKLG